MEGGGFEGVGNFGDLARRRGIVIKVTVGRQQDHPADLVFGNQLPHFRTGVNVGTHKGYQKELAHFICHRHAAHNLGHRIGSLSLRLGHGA